MRSAARNVDQFLFSSSRVRCSLSRQLFKCNRGCGAAACGYIPAWHPVGYGGTGPTRPGVGWTKRDAKRGSSRKGNNQSTQHVADITRASAKKKGCSGSKKGPHGGPCA